jgi:DNA modification methylase
MTQDNQWQNRIIGYKQIPVNQLLANPLNARQHPGVQRDALRGSLDSLGFVSPVIVNTRTNYLLDGHARVEEVLSKDENALIPVIEVDLSEDEERLFLASFDWITTLATYDRDSLDSLLQSVNTDNAALQTMLAGMAESQGLYFGEPPVIPDDMGAQVDRAEELQALWQVNKGDLWVIGNHRLLCGDSTNADDVATVMSGDKAQLVVTDPPYGVSYADKNAMLNSVAPANRIQHPIENDHLSKEDTQALWKSAFKQMSDVMDKGAVVYCFMPQGGDQMMMMMMMMGAGIEPRHELIWLKNNHVLGRVDYAYKHEPILYAWKEGGHKFYGDFQTSIIECNKPLKSDLHPTMKPIELLCTLIENSSLTGEVVYDLFGGSGSTMVACEQLSRQCRMIEISEKYCAVILQRMTDMGLTPVRLETETP